MKVSIVIGAFNHLEDATKPCLESLKKYTDLTDKEVIVVSNGSTDGTADYVRSLGNPFKVLEYKDALGYPKANNEGIRASKGDYIILLNNDTILLEQQKDAWIKDLLEPFSSDSVGIVAPLIEFNREVGRYFAIFFCVAIKRAVFNEIGTLDESFGNGFYEDNDFCWRAEDAGWEIKHKDILIFHQGHQTFKDLSEEKRSCFFRNKATVEARYGLKLDKAKACDGFMSDEELAWLAKEAKKHKVIVEIGSWHGKSTRALGDNTDGVVYAIDHFNGSKTEPQNHGSAKLNDGDHAFLEFCDNNFDLIQSGKIIPLRGTNTNIFNLLKKKGLSADMIFIDAGHTYEEVVEDIENFKQLLAPEGLLCGHDYCNWVGVKQAVDERIPFFGQAVGTSIWYMEKGKQEKGLVYDCFPFFNELDLLEIRLNELNDVVDKFVIVEAKQRQSDCKEKPLNFLANRERFAKFEDKIIYITTNLPIEGDAWTRERFQRDEILKGLINCKDNDVIIISDADEIPNAETIRRYQLKDGLKYLDLNLYYYFLNGYVGRWDQSKILPFRLAKAMTPCQIRYTPCNPIYNAGWHFSYLGGIDKIIEKIEAFAHQEYNNDKIKNKEELLRRVLAGEDIYGRGDKITYVNLDDTFPKFLINNKDKFKHLIYEQNFGGNPNQGSL